LAHGIRGDGDISPPTTLNGPMSRRPGSGSARAVLTTLRYTGLRRNEVSVVRLDGVDLDARRLSVVGKGDKPRIVPIAPPLLPVLDYDLTNL
jgi:site-specific recombinase XerC